MSANARDRSARAPSVAEITDLSHEGHGIAHVDGKAVFIEDALPGERVEWTVAKRARNLDRGRLGRILDASAHRVEPRCPHFGICGGCVLQHLSSAQQLVFKQSQLFDALRRIGKVTPDSLLPALHAHPWNYRRRARLAARWVPKKQRTVVGFRERNTPYIADLKGCEVLSEPVNRLIEPLSLLISALSVRARVPQIEVAVADNAVALVIRILDALTDADLESLRTFASTHGVDIYLQPGGYDTITALQPEAASLEYCLPEYDVALQFQPSDFVQINGELNRRMIDRAISLLEPTEGDRILDLFCGLGNFSLPLARRGAHVTGVEGDAALVARAQANAARHAFSNTEFCVANLAEAGFFDSKWARQPYGKILLDPPRAGALEALPLIARSGAQRVLYISCHPGSLARDAGILVHEHGFKLVSAGVMDMFPHTAHVESAAFFTRSG